MGFICGPDRSRMIRSASLPLHRGADGVLIQSARAASMVAMRNIFQDGEYGFVVVSCIV